MKKNGILISFILLTGFLRSQTLEELPVDINQMNILLDSKKIQIIITNHGGFSPSEMGKSYMVLTRRRNSFIYRVKYYNASHERKLNYKIIKEDFDSLKIVLSDLIKVHQPNKKLDGDWVVIDKNGEIKADVKLIKIYPIKMLSEFHAFDNWFNNAK